MCKNTTDFKAAMTFEQVEKGETKYQSNEKEIGITRRMLFACLTKDKKELIEAVKEEAAAEEFLELVETSSVNIEYLEGVISLMKSASNRLLFVMEEVHGE